ncbi:uncharacterized protein [Halyomorpha halys]|uniref:uncharacterized protein n=1 Tax=Halyomorpha halys TaxID=286706 RepID=UPI0034D23C66
MIPFPAVTICDNRKSCFIPQGEDDSTTRNFREANLFICGHPHPLPQQMDTRRLLEMSPPLSQSCGLSNIYSNKSWRNCTAMFRRIVTDVGACHTFNIFSPSQIFTKGTEIEYEEHNMSSDWTAENRFTVTLYKKLLSGAVETLSCDSSDRLGFKIILHNPHEVPMIGHRRNIWSPTEFKETTIAQYFLLTMERKLELIVEPKLIRADEELSLLPADHRRCYFPGERQLSFFLHYSYSNCQLECVTNLTLNECNCADYYMPRVKGTKLCDRSHLGCISSVLEDWKRRGGNICNCLSSCNIIEYHAKTWYTYSPDPGEIVWNDTSLSVMIEDKVFLVAEKKPMYTKVDFYVEMESGCSNLKNNIAKLKEKLHNRMDVNWSDEHLKEWKAKAEEKQQFYFESLGRRNWEEYLINEIGFLRLKIGFAIFGPSADVEDENMEEPVIHFKDTEQNKTIDQITEAIYIISESNHLYTAFIFVIAYINNEYAEYPIVRVLNKKSNSIFFIDMLARVYKDWNDFTTNNTFPCSICCYPKNGFYSCSNDGKVELIFGYSPENSKLKRFLRKVDTVNGIAGVGSAAVGIAALAVPLSSPVVLGSAAAGLASAVWSTCRTVTTLRDRKKHYQTLSISDQNARTCWISLAAGIIGGASAGAVQYTEFVARTGLVLNRIPCLAVNSLEIGNIGIGGLSIVNHIVNIVEKKECTLSDSIQIILSILFFCHATVSFITAKAIMIDIKSKILNNSGKESNINQQTEFIINFQETLKNKLVEGNAEDIKTLKTIRNEEIFFQELLGIRNNPKGRTSDELIIVHDEMNTCTTDFDLIDKVAKTKLMDSTVKLCSKNKQKILQETNTTSKQENLLIIKNEISKKLNVKNLNDFCIDGEQLFVTASSDEIYIFHKTVEAIENNPKNSNAFEKVLTELKKITHSVSCKNLYEFIMLIQNILRKYEEYKVAYEAVKKIIEKVKLIRLKTDLKKEKASSEDIAHGLVTMKLFDEDGVGSKEE